MNGGNLVEIFDGIDGLDTQEPSNHDVDDGDHLFSRDLSHKNRGKSLFGVYGHFEYCSYDLNCVKFVSQLVILAV